MASRHLSRIAALQALFAADVRDDFSLDALKQTWQSNTDSLAHEDEDHTFTENLLKGVSAKHTEIDGVIAKAAPQWPVAKIAVIDRNVLRLGLFELLYGSTISVPPKVALNEAIELAKMFGGDSSPKFVNGVMGAVYRDMGAPRKDEASKEGGGHKGHAAGVVVCAQDGADWYVALILDPFGKWTLPKSTLGEGELSQDGARRAVYEELGIENVTLSASVGEHEYIVRTPGEGSSKRTALYFAGRAEKTPLTSKKKKSIKDVQWFKVSALPEDALYEDLRILIESGIQTVTAEA